MSGLLFDNSSAPLFSIKIVCVFQVVNEIKREFIFKVIRI